MREILNEYRPDFSPGNWSAGDRHFLEAFVFAVLNRPLPPARVWLIDRLRDAERL